MKKKIIAIWCMAALACALVSGCGSKDAQTEPETVQETAEEPKAASGEETSKPESTPEEPAAESSAAGEKTPETVLEDGVYEAEFDTDSSMFHINEACEGKGTLTVENGSMVIHISLVSKNIEKLYPGLAEDAEKDGAKVIEPTTDTVTYSDGMSEDVYGFDVPVPVLDEEFDLAILGKKGSWYDHKVSVSNPEKAE